MYTKIEKPYTKSVVHEVVTGCNYYLKHNNYITSSPVVRGVFFYRAFSQAQE